MSQVFEDTVRKASTIDLANLQKQDLSKPGRENWTADAEVAACTECHTEFGMFVWRHHCRACGQIFCDKCSSHRIEVHRAHYEPDQEKPKRVCVRCFESKIEEKKARVLIGLRKATVVGVDHDDGQNGSRFFFEAEEWSAMIGADSSKAWVGKSFHIMQVRNGEQQWSGSVIVTRAGPTCSGKRSSGAAFEQWKVDDVIVLGGEQKLLVWTNEDAVRLVSKVDMFDGTVLHIQSSDVTTALKRLNSGGVPCIEGVCVAHCSEPRENYLLVRQDQKKQGSRIFSEYDAQIAKDAM